ncbi:MAG: glycoside hydrolase family 97 N-terminal domain-containing protein, partial [Candidatus Hinthialibacter sp.]
MKSVPSIIGLLFVLACAGSAAAESYTVESPDGRMKMTIHAADRLEYSVSFKEIEILRPSPIGLQLEGEFLGRNPSLLRESRRMVDEIIRPVAPEKRSEIPNRFNELVLHFQGDYSLMARAYDDGVAYRFLTSKYGKIKIVNEHASFRFNEDDNIYYPETESMQTSFESNYRYGRVSDIGAHQLGFLPVLVDRKDGIKIWISEADVCDYPGMFLTGAGSNQPALQASFPPYPLEDLQVRDRTLRVARGAGFIAETEGNRAYPWRVIVAADRDGALFENDLVYRLAPSCQIGDVSWIKPGKVAWDWW